VIRRNEMETLICPNTSICQVYKLRQKEELNIISDDGENYSCAALGSFNYADNLEQLNQSTKKAPKCSLIELLNNSRKL
jgi:hypothetical protein